MDYYLAFSLVFFLFLFLSICVCRALFPVVDVLICVKTHGTGEDLQQKMYALMWLKMLGFFQGTICIVNEGLDSEGEKLLAHLLARWPDLKLCLTGDMPH